MKLGIALLTFTLFLQEYALVKASWQTANYELVRDLFSNYTPTVRPSGGRGTVTSVHIGFHLLSIQSLDEKDQVLESFASLQMYWYDTFMAWNTSAYEDIEYIFHPQENLWLPDIVTANSVDRQVQLGYNKLPCQISSNGLVFWNPTELLRTSCDIDVTYYPFDTQVCYIFLSFAMSTHQDIRLGVDRVSLDRYSAGGTWELIDTHLEVVEHYNSQSRVKVTLKLRRLRIFYILNIILPVMFLSLVASTAFYLPADAGEKMGLSMTILLAYAVYLTIISDNMPQTSLQVSYLAVYPSVLLGVTALAVLLSVVVLSIYHRSEEIPIGLKTARYIRFLRRRFGLCRVKKRSKLKVYPLGSEATIETDDGSGTLKGDNPKARLIDSVIECVSRRGGANVAQSIGDN